MKIIILFLFFNFLTFGSESSCENIIAEVDLTLDFISYLEKLNQDQVLKLEDLEQLRSSIQSGSLKNPVPHFKSSLGLIFNESRFRVHYLSVDSFLHSPDLNLATLFEWLQLKLSGEAAKLATKSKTMNNTKDIFFKLVFHPVKDEAHQKEFYLAELPITQWTFAFVMGEAPHMGSFQKKIFQNISIRGKNFNLNPNAPIDYINQNQVEFFLAKLNRWSELNDPDIYTVIPGHLPGQYYRLPTDEEYDVVLTDQGKWNINNRSDYFQKYSINNDDSNNEDLELAQRAPLIINGSPFYDLFGHTPQITMNHTLRGGSRHLSQAQYTPEHKTELALPYGPTLATFRLVMDPKARPTQILGPVDDSKMTTMSFHSIHPKNYLMGNHLARPEIENLFNLISGKSGELVWAKFDQDFELQETLVTQWMWSKIMGESPAFSKYHSAKIYNNGSEDLIISPEHPIEHISWKEAQAFINKLNQLSLKNDPLLYQLISDHQQGDQFRLPYAKEMEFISRLGGSVTGRFLPPEIRNNFNEYGWDNKNSNKMAQQIKIKSPITVQKKPFYDLFGNVKIFLQDHHEENFKLPVGGGPLVLSNPNYVKTFGISFNDFQTSYLPYRASLLFYADTTSRYDYVGLRLVRIRADKKIK